jgi:hypothetical protein
MVNEFPVSWKMGVLSAEIKRPVPEAVYSSPTRTAVKNGWSFTFTPSISCAFIAWCTIRDTAVLAEFENWGGLCVQKDSGEMRPCRGLSSEGIRDIKLRRLQVGGDVGLSSGHSYDFNESA